MTDIETLYRKGQGADTLDFDYPPRPHVGCHCRQCEPRDDRWYRRGAWLCAFVAALAVGAIIAVAVAI